MKHAIIVVAACIYAFLAGWVVLFGQQSQLSAPTGSGVNWQQTAPATVGSREGLPYRAIGFQVQRVDWMDRYHQSIDEIAAVGADTVKIVVDARQENGASMQIYIDHRMTPSKPQLMELIRHAKSKNLRVILMPIVLLDKPRNTTEWRGTIAPQFWDVWFDSYRNMLQYFAEIAEQTDVDVFVIGSELVSSVNKVREWNKTIAMVRGVYKGKLTFSSNWDHYTNVPFWDQLDLIGMNSYWKLGENHNATTEQIETRWREIQRDLLVFQKRTKKPILFLEVGWCSLQNAAHEPWDYTREEVPVDLELQKRLYEAFFRVWHGNPALGGFSIWEWTPDDGGNENRGYTPKNKPAEQVLREWLKKPRWDVP